MVVLALSWALLVPIVAAFADPADPTWIAGIYDAGDGDEVLLLISLLDGLAEGPRFAIDPVPIAGSVLWAACVGVSAVDRSRFILPRAPPQP